MAALVTIEEFVEFMGCGVESEDITRVNFLLEATSAIIRDYVGHNITETTATVTVDSGGSGDLFLAGAPVTAVSSVTVDGVVEETDSYQWSQSGVLRRATGWSWWWGRWPREFQSVTVTYTYGYEAVPASVKYVCMSAAARSFQNPSGLRSETIGGYSYTAALPSSGVPFGAGLTPLEQQMLDAYRLPVLA